MAALHLAKNPFADPAGLTLQDVLERVASADAPTARQKRESCSAVNSTALWLQRTPSELPASHEYFRRAYDRIDFGTLGIGRPRFRNVQSLVKRGLEIVGVPTSGRSYLAPLNPTWTALKNLIADPYARECLMRFMRFCSIQGVSPDQVSDDIVASYREELQKENLTARPDTAAQSVVRLWNRMVDQVPGWPRVRLTPLLRRETYTLRWEQLPPELVADVDRYLAILGGADPTDPLSPPRPLKPLSIRTRRYQLLQLISALHHQGERVEDLHCLADLCHVYRVKRALQFFIGRHRQRHGEDADPATSMIGGIADAIRAVAKHYAQAPADVVKELSRIAGRLNRRRTGMTEKNRRRLAQLDSPLVEKKLLSHPLIEMQKLAGKNKPSRRDAVRYSVLLAIEILLLAPMRSENLAGLDRDRHFVWPRRGTGDIGIVIPRSEVKNRQPLEYRIPRGPSSAALYTYMDRFLPLLASVGSNALFPNGRGRTKRQDTLAKQISKLLRQDLGIDWNPHAFRHLAVRFYLRAHPGDYEGARRLMAHLSGETTYNTYEEMEMRPAVERLDRIIESIRGSGLFTQPPRRRRDTSIDGAR